MTPGSGWLSDSWGQDAEELQGLFDNLDRTNILKYKCYFQFQINIIQGFSQVFKKLILFAKGYGNLLQAKP
jgi:hypothetical protein